MIDARELRVGNFLSFEGKPLKVMYVGETIGMDFSTFGGDGATLKFQNNPVFSEDIKDLQPIHLTPEILEKAGFKYGVTEGVARIDEDNDPNENTYYWDLSCKRNRISDGLTFSIVKWGIKGDFTFSSQWMRVKLFSVHQLQNLYFCLTGEELEINLP